MIVPTPLVALSLRNGAAALDALATDPRGQPNWPAILTSLATEMRGWATMVDKLPPWAEG